LVDNSEVFERAAEGGHLDLLEWAVKFLGDPNYFSLRRAAARGGCLEILRWIEDLTGIDVLTNDTIEEAAERGRLELLRWMTETRGVTLPSEICCWAARGGHVDVIEWAMGDYGCSWTTWALEEAQLHHQAEILKWAKFQKSSETPMVSLNHGAISGNIEIGRMAREAGRPWTPLVVPVAAKKGNLAFMKWAIKNGCPWDPQAVYKAALRGGNFKILSWLVDSQKCRWTSGEIARSAVTTGSKDSFRILKWVTTELVGRWRVEDDLEGVGRVAVEMESYGMLCWVKEAGWSWTEEQAEEMAKSRDGRIRRLVGS
jgi:hypothetical protein